MTAPTSLRHLTREAHQQQRLKARVAAWWHVERCPRDTERLQFHRAALPVGLRALLTENLHTAPGPKAPDRDDTPTH